MGGLLLALFTGRAIAAEPLQPPPGYRVAGGQGGASTPCEAPPAPFTGTLDFPSKYEGSGKARDQINPEAEDEYENLTRPITSMEKGVVERVAIAVHSGSPDDAKCAVSWFKAWADAGAMLGSAKNSVGRSMRKWSLGSMASAYVQLKFASSAPLKAYPNESQKIESWLSTIADRVVAEWSPDDSIDRINNHYYWAAWAMMATSVATNRRDLFDRSLAIFRVFERQVDSDGYLPNEVKRASRAANYHNYAMQPISMIAAFAKANGVDLASENNQALVRFAHRVETAFDDPQNFASKAGVAQNRDGFDKKTSRIWLEPYCWTVSCTASERALLESSRPLANTRLGGDLTAVFASAH